MAKDSITIRTTEEIIEALNDLADAMDRPRNWVVEVALKSYLDVHSWQVSGIKKALQQVESGKVVAHEQVFGQLKKSD